MRDDLIHIIECDAPRVSRRRLLARCGAAVEDQRIGEQPTCPECLRLDAEDASALANLIIESNLEDNRGNH